MTTARCSITRTAAPTASTRTSRCTTTAGWSTRSASWTTRTAVSDRPAPGAARLRDPSRVTVGAPVSRWCGPRGHGRAGRAEEGGNGALGRRSANRLPYRRRRSDQTCAGGSGGRRRRGTACRRRRLFPCLPARVLCRVPLRRPLADGPHPAGLGLGVGVLYPLGRRRAGGGRHSPVVDVLPAAPAAGP